MKILIISNPVISNITNMGKTLKAYFSNFEVDEVAQLYIHSQFPNDGEICTEYYRFTDLDALKSIFSSKYKGISYGKSDIKPAAVSVHEDVGSAEVLYQVGSQKTPILQIGRNLVWKLGRWFNPDLKAWLDQVAPDMIFFASGESVFMYDVALKVADYLKVPLVISCYDDYYFFDINGTGLLARHVHKQLVKKAKAVFQRSCFATTVCDTMAREYEKLFGKKCYVLYTGAQPRNMKPNLQAKQISYLGNVSLGRNEQLADLGRALMKLNLEHGPKCIDVYSPEKDPEILRVLTPENGICFHGGISADAVLSVMQNSMAVIHTESFDENLQNRVRFSVSTKIADSVMNGPCILAYGPRGIASMDYLAENHAAYVIDSKEKLESGLREFCANEALRGEIIHNARSLAEKNHDLKTTASVFRGWMETCLKMEENAQ